MKVAKVALSREVGLECLLLAGSTSVLLRQVAYVHCGTGIECFGLVWFGLVWFGGGKCHLIDRYFPNFNNRNLEEL